MKIKLGDAIKINTNSYTSKMKWKYVNYLDTGNITEGTISNIQYIDLEREQLPDRAKRLVHYNSIVYSTVRPIQRHYGIIREQPENFLVSTGFVVIDADEDKIDSNYLYFYLSQDIIVNHLQAIAQSSVSSYPSIRPSDICDMEIDLPSLSNQKRIGNFLYVLLSKLENNNKINSELESLAKTIYDYWFLQFDFPNEEGKPYKSSGGAMEYNEELKMDIPKGWEVKKISELAEIYQPQTISNNLMDNSLEFPVYGGGGYIGRYSKYNHKDSEVIITCRGSCGEIYQTLPCSWITGNAMVVHPLNDKLTKNYLYQFLKTFGVQNYLTGSVQKQLTRDNLSLMSVLCPERSVLAKFEEIAHPITLQIQQIEKENRDLSSLRDYLLPLLMNGQVGFKDE